MSKISIKNPFPMSIKKILLISGITILVGTVIVIILAVISSVQSIPPKDFYELVGNRIPAYESVVGKREGIRRATDSGELEYAYARSSDSPEDAKSYVKYLCENEGFHIDDEIPGAISFSKDAAQDSVLLEMLITFPENKTIPQDISIEIVLYDVANHHIFGQ